jgi:hypothetical protein
VEQQTILDTICRGIKLGLQAVTADEACAAEEIVDKALRAKAFSEDDTPVVFASLSFTLTGQCVALADHDTAAVWTIDGPPGSFPSQIRPIGRMATSAMLHFFRKQKRSPV